MKLVLLLSRQLFKRDKVKVFFNPLLWIICLIFSVPVLVQIINVLSDEPLYLCCCVKLLALIFEEIVAYILNLLEYQELLALGCDFSVLTKAKLKLHIFQNW